MTNAEIGGHQHDSRGARVRGLRITSMAGIETEESENECMSLQFDGGKKREDLSSNIARRLISNDRRTDVIRSPTLALWRRSKSKSI